MFSHVPTAKMSAVQFGVPQFRPEGLERLPRVQMQKFVQGSLFSQTYFFFGVRNIEISTSVAYTYCILQMCFFLDLLRYVQNEVDIDKIEKIISQSGHFQYVEHYNECHGLT